jgi:hypothetical protein
LAGLILSCACFVDSQAAHGGPGWPDGSTGSDPTSSGDHLSTSGRPGPDSTTGAESDSETEAEPTSETSGDEPGDSTSTGAADDSGQGQTTGAAPVLDCCAPELGPGCADAAIEACVCEQDPYCCDNAWDIACAVSVEPMGCGACEMQDDIASCKALCTTFVECAPNLGYTEISDCVQGECLGLLDQAQAEGEECSVALAKYNACIGLLDCASFSNYVNAEPPDAFPCKGFQDAMFAACPFATAGP